MDVTASAFLTDGREVKIITGIDDHSRYCVIARAVMRTLPCPVPPRDRHRLRGARRAPSRPLPPPGPVTVQRRVSQRGAIMVATQRIHVGMIHARKTVTGTEGEHGFQVSLDGETIDVVPRTTTREVHRYKASASPAQVRA